MSEHKLPLEYEKIKEINLVTDKKAATIVNTISFILIIVMIILGAYMYGKSRLANLLLLDERSDLLHFIIKVLMIIALCAIYVIFHEAIHAFLMKAFCGNSKVTMGYRFFYAYAASDGYYDKRAYNIIAVAPLLFFGVVLSILCAVVPIEWFWTFYIVQIFNFSAASGDIYVFFLISRMPKNILVRDNGTEIIVYGR